MAIREGANIRLIAQRMPENMVHGGDVASPETMSRFLKSIREQEHVRERNCVLVLDTTQVYFRHVTLPPMTIPELQLNLPYEFRDYIQGNPEEYVYDYAVDAIERNEEGDVVRMDLYAAAASKPLVESYNQMLRKAGFKLKMITTAPMAYMRLLKAFVEAHNLYMEEGQDVVLVDLGHADVTVSLFRGLDYDSARTIEFGCDEFDNVIADLKGIDPYTACSYKYTNFEGVLDDPACTALCDRFALEVSKVVNFYNFSNPDREIGQLFFMGGGARIPQLTRAITDAIPVSTTSIEEILPDEAQGQEHASVCTLAVAGLLEGEAM